MESTKPKRCKPDYDNELYLHQLQELHQWAMGLQGACMHHEEDSVNHKEKMKKNSHKKWFLNRGHFVLS